MLAVRKLLGRRTPICTKGSELGPRLPVHDLRRDGPPRDIDGVRRAGRWSEQTGGVDCQGWGGKWNRWGTLTMAEMVVLGA